MRLARVIKAALVLLLLFGGCEARQHEEAARLAVRSLVAAPPEAAKKELSKVVALGRYALPDIEQEFHSADTKGRLRLLAALEKLKLPEAKPFLRVVARWARDDEVRKQAKHLLLLR